MERIKRLVQTLRQQSAIVTEEQIIHLTREYLQVLVLKIIFQSKFGSALSFMGGTCLRICHNSKRYSEDLDFCLDEPKSFYHFPSMTQLIQKELQLQGLSVTSNIQEEKMVQKSFLRVDGLKELLDLKTFRSGQKLHIKLEVDIHPPLLKKEERESFFVSRLQEIFPILKHNIPTLFSGKILDILQRSFDRGRDYYDLIWYLSQKASLNLNYLNRGLKGRSYKTMSVVLKSIEEKIKEVKPEMILKDIGRFLEDPHEEAWIRQYQKLFLQLKKQYLS